MKKKKQVRALGAVVVDKERSFFGEHKLLADSVWLDSPDLIVPCFFDGSKCGEAKLFHRSNGNAYADITFAEDLEPTILSLYASPGGRVEQMNPGTQEITKFCLTSVELTLEPPFPEALPLIYTNEQEIVKEFISNELSRLQKKKWSPRRIRRFFKEKYNILLQ